MKPSARAVLWLPRRPRLERHERQALRSAIASRKSALPVAGDVGRGL